MPFLIVDQLIHVPTDFFQNSIFGCNYSVQMGHLGGEESGGEGDRGFWVGSGWGKGRGGLDCARHFII